MLCVKLIAIIILILQGRLKVDITNLSQRRYSIRTREFYRQTYTDKSTVVFQSSISQTITIHIEALQKCPI